MFSCKATQRSTQALGAAQGACAAERFTGAHPPSRAGPLSDYKVAVDASVRRRSGRMCRRKVHWRSSSPQSWATFRLKGSGRRKREAPLGVHVSPKGSLRSSFPAELGPFRSQGHGRPCLSAAHAPRALCFTGIYLVTPASS